MKSLPRSCPSAMGVDPAGILELYQALNQLNCHQVMIARNNQVIAEGYWAPYREGYEHIAYSVSKSFTSTAVGLAIDEGLLSEEDYVISFFPEDLPYEPCENMKKMKVRHLLTMSVGIRNERGVQDDEATWLQKFLYNYVDEEPGSRFSYNSGSTYVLSCIVRKVTGMNVFDYLKLRIFDKIGFSDTIWWEKSPEGINNCFNGLNATAEDFTKLGLLYLNDGVWSGERLLSHEWVQKAQALQIDNSNNDENRHVGDKQGFGPFSDDYKCGYGYLFWHCVHEGAYRGDGIYGQLCIIMPKENMVVSVLAGHDDPGKILEAVWKHLVPAVDRPAGSITDEAAAAYLKKLHLEIPQGERLNEAAVLHSGTTYRFAQNGLGLETLRLDFGKENFLTITTKDGMLCTPIGYGEWINCKTGYDPERFGCDNQFFYDHVGCCGAWQGDSFMLRLAFTRTPFVEQMRIRFHKGCMHIHFWHTVRLYQMEHDLIGVPCEVLNCSE